MPYLNAKKAKWSKELKDGGAKEIAQNNIEIQNSH